MAVSKTNGTTEQQKLFAYAYFNNGGNATQAAITAGYSPKSATQVASRLLTYVNVSELITSLQNEVKERVIVSKEEIARELQRIGFRDVRKAYTVDNALKSIRDLDDDIAATVTGVKVFEEFSGSGDEREKIGETVELKFDAKIPALAELNKMFGYYAPTKIAATDPSGNAVPTGPFQVQIVKPTEE